MTSSPQIHVLPATPDRWDDVVTLLGGDGDRGCWCQSWRGSEVPGETRRDALQRQLTTPDPPPGFLAYRGDQVAGWVGVSLRSRAPRLARSRTLPALDDRDVWCVGCFRIRPGHRRIGVASALLEGVVAAARAVGAPGVEAWPIDPSGARVDVGLGYVGLASMFDRAGFRRVTTSGARSAGLPRLVVRFDLDPPTA